MRAQLFGVEHILYIIVTTLLSVVGLLFAYKYAKTEKSKTIILKSLAFAYGVILLSVELIRKKKISQVSN